MGFICGFTQGNKAMTTESIMAVMGSPRAVLQARMVAHHYSNVLGMYERKSAECMAEVLSAYDTQHQDWDCGFRALTLFTRYEREAAAWT